MLEDYKKAVIFDYHQKKVKGLLSLNLSHTTPAKLRHECLLVLNARPQIKDEKIIGDFFNLGLSKDYYSSIERFDPEKLKPLDNYLKGKTVSTEPRNIELLAWLIDFEPRPYQYGVIYPAEGLPPKEIKDIKEVPKPEQLEKEETENLHKTSKRVYITKYGVGLIILFLLLSSGIGVSMRNASIERTTIAYICTSKVAKKYHLKAECHGLNNCKSKIVPTTVAEAKKTDKTMCEIEH